MLQTKFVVKIKTHVLCSITFVKIIAVYEILWKNIAQPYRPHTKMLFMPVASWRSKATETHSE